MNLNRRFTSLQGFNTMTTMTLQVPDFMEADHQDTVQFIASNCTNQVNYL